MNLEQIKAKIAILAQVAILAQSADEAKDERHDPIEADSHVENTGLLLRDLCMRSWHSEALLFLAIAEECAQDRETFAADLSKFIDQILGAVIKSGKTDNSFIEALYKLDNGIPEAMSNFIKDHMRGGIQISAPKLDGPEK